MAAKWLTAEGGKHMGGTYGASSYNFNMGGGGVFDITGNQLVGTIDEVAIWEVALSEAEVETMYDAATSVGGGFAEAVLATDPLGYWRLNEEEGTVAANLGLAGEQLDGVYDAGYQGDPGPELPVLSQHLAYTVGDDGNSYVSVPNSPLSLQTEFSIAGWVKYQTLGDRIGLFGQNDAIEFGFIDTDTVQVYTAGGEYWISISSMRSFQTSGSMSSPSVTGRGDSLR